MTALELSVVLPQQIEVHTAIDVQIPNRDVVLLRRHFGDIHEALGQPKQNVGLTTMGLQPHRDGDLDERPPPIGLRVGPTGRPLQPRRAALSQTIAVWAA
jgi:hypothetical protein